MTKYIVIYAANHFLYLIIKNADHVSQAESHMPFLGSPPPSLAPFTASPGRQLLLNLIFFCSFLFSTICQSSILFSLLIPVPGIRPADVSALYWLSMSRSGRYTRGMMITLKRAFGHSLTTLQSDVYLKKKKKAASQHPVLY